MSATVTDIAVLVQIRDKLVRNKEFLAEAHGMLEHSNLNLNEVRRVRGGLARTMMDVDGLNTQLNFFMSRLKVELKL